MNSFQVRERTRKVEAEVVENFRGRRWPTSATACRA